MGDIFQAKWWGKHPCGCPFGLLWLRKMEKEMVKALERKNGISSTFICENNGN